MLISCCSYVLVRRTKCLPRNLRSILVLGSRLLLYGGLQLPLPSIKYKWTVAALHSLTHLSRGISRRLRTLLIQCTICATVSPVRVASSAFCARVGYGWSGLKTHRWRYSRLLQRTNVMLSAAATQRARSLAFVLVDPVHQHAPRLLRGLPPACQAASSCIGVGWSPLAGA
jgi:hypothetical protein